VAKTLISITDGITQANELFESSLPFKLLGGDQGAVEFEISIGVEEKSSKRAAAGFEVSKILVFGAKIGGQGELSTLDAHKNTIRFKVWVANRPIFTRKKELTGGKG
jgi:hypothetical protein